MRRKRRITINEEGHAHALTFSVYRRVPVFADPNCADIFLKVLDEARQRQNFDLLAYVVMPDHAHILLVPRGKHDISTILRSIKQPSSRFLMRYLEEHGPRLANELTVQTKAGNINRLWQQGGGFDKNVTDQRAANNIITYFHQNPVRKGLCEFATDWPWSSASAYEGGDAPVPINTWWFTGEE